MQCTMRWTRTMVFPASGPEQCLYRKGATGIYIRILLAELQLKSRRPVHAYLAFDAEATASTIVYTAELGGSAGRLKKTAARMQVPADRVAEIKISPLNH